ncbi:MAG: hypothetical protein U5R06_22005 [candidate division KSB1 bacterium]|nr:hypothetical protein [candidate division KSB1 bacterium]
MLTKIQWYMCCIFFLFTSIGLTHTNSSNQIMMSPNDPMRDPDWDWYSDNSMTVDLYCQAGDYDDISMPWSNGGHAIYEVFLDNGYKDIYPADGWELLLRDFGTETRDAPWPYFILYNKYIGLLRLIYWGIPQGEGVSYATGTIQFIDGYSPIFELSQLEQAGYLNDNSTQDKVEELYVISKFYPEHWNYFDFPVSGYDPEIYTNEVKVRIDIDLFSEFKVELAGSSAVNIENSQLDVRPQTNNGLVTALTKTLETGKKYYTDISKEWKTLSDAQDEMSDILKWAKGISGQTWWTQILTNLSTINKASWIPALGPVAAIINFMSGGGASNSNNLTAAVSLLPRTITLEGSFTKEWPYNGVSFYLPGCNVANPSQAISDNTLPIYDNPFGVFNMVEKPTVDYGYQYSHSVDDNLCDPPTMARDYFDVYYSLTDNVSYVVNPYVFDLAKSSVKFSYASEETGNLCDFIAVNNADFYSDYVEHMQYVSLDYQSCAHPLGIGASEVKAALLAELVPYDVDANFVPAQVIKAYDIELGNDLGLINPATPIYPFDIVTQNIYTNTTLHSCKIVQDITVSGCTLSIAPGSIILLAPDVK